jgi:hypothetical protein
MLVPDFSSMFFVVCLFVGCVDDGEKEAGWKGG